MREVKNLQMRLLLLLVNVYEASYVLSVEKKLKAELRGLVSVLKNKGNQFIYFCHLYNWYVSASESVMLQPLKVIKHH